MKPIEAEFCEVRREGVSPAVAGAEWLRAFEVEFLRLRASMAGRSSDNIGRGTFFIGDYLPAYFNRPDMTASPRLNRRSAPLLPWCAAIVLFGVLLGVLPGCDTWVSQAPPLAAPKVAKPDAEAATVQLAPLERELTRPNAAASQSDSEDRADSDDGSPGSVLDEALIAELRAIAVEDSELKRTAELLERLHFRVDISGALGFLPVSNPIDEAVIEEIKASPARRAALVRLLAEEKHFLGAQLLLHRCFGTPDLERLSLSTTGVYEVGPSGVYASQDATGKIVLPELKKQQAHLGRYWLKRGDVFQQKGNADAEER